MTQDLLAEKAGVSQGMISQLETGASDYSGDLLEKLSGPLECTPADLIMRDPFETEPLWSIWNRLKPERRKQAIRVLTALAEEDSETK